MNDRPPRLILGDCLVEMAGIEDGSVDAVVTDPPYPCVRREYGEWTEAEWFGLMRGVVAHCRRILKPSGSAVFVLQPNGRGAGSMRPWLWEFMAWACREWNMVQDAWWWNTRAMPSAGATEWGLMRPSVKACVWLGAPDCHRDQDAVLWDESASTRARRQSERANREHGYRSVSPGGFRHNISSVFNAIERRGGVTPYNLIPADHGYSRASAGAHGHPAGTPETLCDWWIRYLCPEGGTVCDPFMGSGTVGLAALKRGRSFIGIERDPAYFATASRRLAEAAASTPLFSGEMMTAP